MKIKLILFILIVFVVLLCSVFLFINVNIQRKVTISDPPQTAGILQLASPRPLVEASVGSLSSSNLSIAEPIKRLNNHTESPQTHTNTNRLLSTEEIETLARHATGLDRVGIFQYPKLTNALEIDIPFLGESMSGRQMWTIEVTNIALRLKSASTDAMDTLARKASIVVDAKSGQLMEVRISATSETGIFPEPSREIAERQMRNSGETYVGFPLEPPRICLLNALDAIMSNGIGSPFLAKEIRAVYVDRSKMDGTVSPVWAVTLFGIPPLKPHGTGAEAVPLNQRTHIRNIVDSKSGKVLNATTIPQVENSNNN